MNAHLGRFCQDQRVLALELESGSGVPPLRMDDAGSNEAAGRRFHFVPTMNVSCPLP